MQARSALNRMIAAVIFVFLLPLAALAGPVNVNTADAETISVELKGIGMTKAQAIVEFREANGPFETLSDLLAVKGIGARTLEINKDDILLDSPRQQSD